MSDKDAQIEKSSGNVFTDLGLPEAAEHARKAELVHQIETIVRRRKLTQAQAAKLLGLSQPDVSRLLRGQFRDFSLERLIRLLMALDRDVELVIKRKPKSARRPARFDISAA